MHDILGEVVEDAADLAVIGLKYSPRGRVTEDLTFWRTSPTVGDVWSMVSTVCWERIA
jgi:hypothetical protein